MSHGPVSGKSSSEHAHPGKFARSRSPRAAGRAGGPDGDVIVVGSRAAQSAHHIDHQDYQQKQANPSSANDGAAKVKTAAAEQEKKNKYK